MIPWAYWTIPGRDAPQRRVAVQSGDLPRQRERVFEDHRDRLSAERQHQHLGRGHALQGVPRVASSGSWRGSSEVLQFHTVHLVS